MSNPASVRLLEIAKRHAKKVLDSSTAQDYLNSQRLEAAMLEAVTEANNEALLKVEKLVVTLMGDQ